MRSTTRLVTFITILTTLSGIIHAGPKVPTDLNPGDQYHLVFVTSTTRDARSSNIADYNQFVQKAAEAVGLHGVKWRAIASTPSVHAIDNIALTPGVPIYRFDGMRVADSSKDLFDGSLLNPINVTETSEVIEEFVYLQYGTTYDGGTDGLLRPACGRTTPLSSAVEIGPALILSQLSKSRVAYL